MKSKTFFAVIVLSLGLLGPGFLWDLGYFSPIGCFFFQQPGKIFAAAKKPSSKRNKDAKKAKSKKIGNKKDKKHSQKSAAKANKNKFKKDQVVSLTSQERAERQLYSQCRQKAAGVSPGSNTHGSDVKAKLAVCRELFPVASLLLECKKKALKDSAQDPDKLANSLKTCEDFKSVIDFNAEQKYPFFVFKDQLFFAGLGLNYPTDSEHFRPMNYDCQKLKSAIKSRKNAAYMLFGSNTSDFLSQDQSSDFLKKGRDQQLIKTDEASGSTFYFPSAPCVYIGTGGESFKALNLYYLIDPNNSKIWPYFGVAFYSSPKQAPRLNEAQNLLLQRLNGQYFPVKERKNKIDIIRIARQKVSRFDSEGDPKNLCRSPRKHDFIFVVKSFPKSDRVEYILAANIKNLCTYGDELVTFLIHP